MILLVMEWMYIISFYRNGGRKSIILIVIILWSTHVHQFEREIEAFRQAVSKKKYVKSK